MVHAIRHETGIQIPAIVITGDISPVPAGAVKELGCPLLYKPVNPITLHRLILRLASPREIKN